MLDQLDFIAIPDFRRDSSAENNVIVRNY
jgi:hypothetical protein